MLDLVNNYSFGEIVTFIVILCIAVKGVVSFWDWASERIKKSFNKEVKEEQKDKDVLSSLNDAATAREGIIEKQISLEEKINHLAEKINGLVDSDKDDIKAFLTREHHYFCYQKGWIDDYSLDCIEKRYSHYVREGGNSFIRELMEEMRDLPKQPPKE